MSKEKDVQWSCPSLYTDIVGRTIGLHIYRKHLYSSEELFIMPYIYMEDSDLHLDICLRLQNDTEPLAS